MLLASLAAVLTDCRRSSQTTPEPVAGSGTAAAPGKSPAESPVTTQDVAAETNAAVAAAARSGKKAAPGAKVEFKGLEDFKLHGLSGVDIYVRVANNTGKRLTLDSGEFTVKLDGRRLASGSLSEPVTIEKRSDGVVVVPVKVNIDNPLVLLSAVSAFRSDASRLTLSGSGTVKAMGVVKKNLKIEDVPADKIMAKMGIDKESILKKIKL